jgi:hypothetical protein
VVRSSKIGKRFSILQSVRTVSSTNSASYSVRSSSLLPADKGLEREPDHSLSSSSDPSSLSHIFKVSRETFWGQFPVLSTADYHSTFSGFCYIDYLPVQGCTSFTKFRSHHKILGLKMVT